MTANTARRARLASALLIAAAAVALPSCSAEAQIAGFDSWVEQELPDRSRLKLPADVDGTVMSNNPKLFALVMTDADGNEIRVSQEAGKATIQPDGSESFIYYPVKSDILIRSLVEELEINEIRALRFSGIRYATDTTPEVKFGKVVFLFDEHTEYALVIDVQHPDSEADALDAAEQLARTYEPRTWVSEMWRQARDKSRSTGVSSASSVGA